MNFNIDSILLILFMLGNLLAGLSASRGIKSIKEYAVGDRNFSTSTLIATIVATWISGEYFFTHLAETYSNGLYFVLATFGNFLVFYLIGKVFAPRLGEFLGYLSIAEAMGALFGKNVRIITSIAGMIATSGVIAVQLKVASLVLEYSLGIPAVYGIIIAGVIIIFYSSLGGIKSVTFTDVIQLFTFLTVIPSIAIFLFGSIKDVGLLVNTYKTNELFNF